MNPERWERIARLYAEALSHSDAERASFLHEATGGDDDLRREIMSLLAEEAARSVLDSPMLESAADVLAVETTLGRGTRLKHYEIEHLLGVGGMGEVYRARDTRLGRPVALKLLPPDLEADVDRLARLQREAQILASLNHSAIGAIYGLEEGGLLAPDGAAVDAAAVHALVLELVEGPTLAERIATHPMPIDDAVAIARQIAGALQAAHEHGIVHRDLKPANITLRPDGVVKVLDFGLATLAESPTASSGNAPANTPPDAGPAPPHAASIVGTAPYISPEQANGEAADKRSDIWAFGCVMYEMLTGKRAFAGRSVRDILASVLQTEPDWAALPADTPESIRTLLTRTLVKDRRRRIGDMAVVLYLLEDAVQPAGRSTMASAARRQWAPTAIAAGVLAGALITGGLWWSLPGGPDTPPQSSVRFEIAVPTAQGFAQNSRGLAISPDGRRVVYPVGSESQLVVRALDDLVPRPLAGATRANSPFFSRDGRWIAFFGAGGLSKISTDGGGAVVALCAIGAPHRGGTWGADDTILFATADRQTGLMRIPVGGGTPEVLTRPDLSQGEIDHWYPKFLPNGRAVLFTIVRGDPERFDVAVVDVETRRTRVLIEGGSQPVFISSGHLVFVAHDSLRAVGFDPETLEVGTNPGPVIERVDTTSGFAQFDASPSGTLLYAPAANPSSSAPERSVVWVERSGREQSLGIPLRPFAAARLAPDERRIALDIGVTGFEHAIWLWDVHRHTLTPLNTETGDETQPVWTLDGERIIFRSERGGSPNVYWQRADGSDPAEPLFPTPRPQFPYSLSPDGTRLFLAQLSPPTQADIGVLKLNDRRTELLIQTPFQEFGAEVSPDGRWLAYQSNESGQYEIYVRPLPDVDQGRWQISTSGGTRPAWARNGRELYYVDASDRLTAVTVGTSGGTFSAGTPVTILSARYVVNAPGTTYGRGYDVAADGRFLMIKNEEGAGDQPARSSLIVIHNWPEELRRVIPVD
jgi:serine/threonine protein kinase/Tol biopolymer transport system component